MTHTNHRRGNRASLEGDYIFLAMIAKGYDPQGSASKMKRIVEICADNNPVNLMDFIEAIEDALGKKAKKNMVPLQPGDVPATWADVNDLTEDFGYRPGTPLKEGIKKFIAWYRSFYNV